MGRLQMLRPRVAVAGAQERKPWGHAGRESRQARGYGAEWDRTRKRVLARDCGLCQPCKRAGIITQAIAVDHVIPKFEGGTDDESNLQSICGPCHREKTAEESKRARGC